MYFLQNEALRALRADKPLIVSPLLHTLKTQVCFSGELSCQKERGKQKGREEQQNTKPSFPPLKIASAHAFALSFSVATDAPSSER